MLATMRPNQTPRPAHAHAHAHSPAHSHLQASSSNNSSRTNSARNSPRPGAVPVAAADSPVKLSTSGKKNRSSHGGKTKSKKATQQQQQQQQSAQPYPIASTTPGLITLSKPVDFPETPSRKSNAASSKKSATRKAAAPAAATAAPDSDALSKSAPLPAAAPALTWQQQMLNAGAGGAGTPSKSKATKPPAAPDKALTWQQELFTGKAPRTGPHFDVFADSRDAETFGGGSNGEHGVGGSFSHDAKPSKARRNKTLNASLGDLSLDDVFSSASPQSKPMAATRRSNATHTHAPVTPSKVGAGVKNEETAYAGPDFHNSPSAASLPAPQFMRRNSNGKSKGKSGSALSGTASTDSDEEAEKQRRRQDRGTTAPPALAPQTHGTLTKSATIENLLVQMMGSAA